MKRVKHEVAPMENSQNTQPENMLERERQAATGHDEQLQTHSAQVDKCISQNPESIFSAKLIHAKMVYLKKKTQHIVG